MSNVRRIYVEKKEPYAVKAKELHDELKNYLGIDVAKVREFIRYDGRIFRMRYLQEPARPYFPSLP